MTNATLITGHCQYWPDVKVTAINNEIIDANFKEPLEIVNFKEEALEVVLELLEDLDDTSEKLRTFGKEH